MAKTTEVLPHNLDAEKSVLAACMLNEEWAKVAIPQLTKDHFLNLRHQSVFFAMQKLHEKGRPVDAISVQDYLKSKGSKVTALEILELNDNTFALTSCNYHLEILKRCELQRRLIKFAVNLKGMAETSQEDIESVRKQALELIMPLLTDDVSAGAIEK